jgi:hypothetical protein
VSEKGKEIPAVSVEIFERGFAAFPPTPVSR